VIYVKEFGKLKLQINKNSYLFIVMKIISF